MFAQLRALLFKKAIQALATANRRTRRTHTLASARSIGVLFDATNDKVRREMADFVKKLEKDGKKVNLLGFFNSKQAPTDTSFDVFFLKEINWKGQPKSVKSDSFSAEKFDLLLSYNPDACPALDWVAVASQAAMKIGLATRQPNDFDIQLETPEEKGLSFFTEQLHLYLDKIVLTKS